jgi:hypothetical protein
MPYRSPPSGVAALISQSVFTPIGQTAVLDAGRGTIDGRIHLVFPGAQAVEPGLLESSGAGDLRQASGDMHQADERCPVAGPGLLAQGYTTISTAFSETAS